MFKTPLSRIASDKADAKASDKKGATVEHNDEAHAQEGIKHSVSVNKHHDGHYSVAEQEGAEPVHHEDFDQAMEHVESALEPGEEDEASADHESVIQGSRKDQSASRNSVVGKGQGIVRY